MLMNRLIGVALALGVIVVSVHAYNPDLSKTENLAAHTVTYKTTQRQIIIDDADTLATVTLRFAPCPPPTIRQVSFEQRIDFIKRFIAPTTAAAATIKVNKSRPIISKKKITLRKSNLSKTKTHDFKFILPDEFKSDMKFSYEQQRHSRSCPSDGFRPEGCADSFVARLVDGESSRYSNSRYPISELHAARQTEQGFSRGSSQPGAKWPLVRTGAHQSRELRGLRGQAAQKGVVRGPRSSDRKVSRVSVRRVQSHSWSRAGRSGTTLQANLISKTKPITHHHHGGHHRGGHHHSGPQKISGGPPSHLTGCGS